MNLLYVCEASSGKPGLEALHDLFKAGTRKPDTCWVPRVLKRRALKVIREAIRGEGCRGFGVVTDRAAHASDKGTYEKRGSVGE